MFIHEPRVYLVGCQTVDRDALEGFLADHDVEDWRTDTEIAGQVLCEVAGRLCYWSFTKPRPGGNSAYLHHLLEVGHGSVLEHAVFNFIVAGVSRSFTHELVRHRVGFSYSQLSQRFVRETDCDFVIPKVIADDPVLYDAYNRSMNSSQLTYRFLIRNLAPKFEHIEDRTLRRKKILEAARSVLPNATETKIFITSNVRALRHFIELRADPGADVEIRKVAIAMLRILWKAAPGLFGDYDIVEQDDGSHTAHTDYRKV